MANAYRGSQQADNFNENQEAWQKLMKKDPVQPSTPGEMSQLPGGNAVQPPLQGHGSAREIGSSGQTLPIDQPSRNATKPADQNLEKPMPLPVDKNEDAGLAPWFGAITAVVLVGFLIWRYIIRRHKGNSQQQQAQLPSFNENDRKMLDLACNLMKIVKNT